MEIFKKLSEARNWTPAQISDLTLVQIYLYTAPGAGVSGQPMSQPEIDELVRKARERELNGRV